MVLDIKIVASLKRSGVMTGRGIRRPTGMLEGFYLSMVVVMGMFILWIFIKQCVHNVCTFSLCDMQSKLIKRGGPVVRDPSFYFRDKVPSLVLGTKIPRAARCIQKKIFLRDKIIKRERKNTDFLSHILDQESRYRVWYTWEEIILVRNTRLSFPIS